MTVLEPGKVLDRRYRIIQTLAKGGFGRTYVAEDTRRPGNPQCVVKHLKPASHDSAFLDHARRLFAVEAETLEQLGTHDQIPRLLAYFEEDQEFYLVQDLIAGRPLSFELQANQVWSERHIWQMLQDILRILVFVHSCGVIHRDIKPDNIIRRQHDGKLVLVDFGAVKQIQSQPSQGHVTSTIAVGTPGYMPTEQSNGKPRPNSDIYALGIIGIQAATGLTPAKLPEDVDTGELIWSSSHIPDELAAILARMVRYHFKDRYQSASETLYAIEQLLDQYPSLGAELRYSSISLKSTPSKQNLQKLPASYPPELSLPKLTEPMSSLEDTLVAPSVHSPVQAAVNEDTLVSVGEALQEPLPAPPITELASALPSINSLSTASASRTHASTGPTDVQLDSVPADADSERDRAALPTPNVVPTSELIILPSTIIDLQDVVASPDSAPNDRLRMNSPPSLPQTARNRRLNDVWLKVPRHWRRNIHSNLSNRFRTAGFGIGGLGLNDSRINFPFWKAILGAGLVTSMLVIGIPAVVRALLFIEHPESNSPSLATLPASQILVVGVPCRSIAPQNLADQQPLQLNNGSTSVNYYGATQAGKPADGQGTSLFANGDRFDGEFRNGVFNGCGTVTFADNYVKTYVGQFQNGLYQGIGLLTWQNGDRYIGQFEKGKCHGEGTFISAKHQQPISGTWRNGNLVGSDLSCNKENK
jgi:serine/threonine protein kinase